ncbi:MAG: radical SAM protein [Dehalococcoidales bacterium]|nr:radical SAM protein [Dehalococcoidales bacterium]
MKTPVYVDWAITSVCNLNCRHCVGMEKGELTHEQAVKIADEIVSLAPRWVILEGGEPLLRPDLSEIGGKFQRAGIDVFVITNGNAFTEERLEQLATFSPKVLFSIDGANAAVYEFTKRGANFETAKKWAQRCAGRGIFHGITTVLSRLNLTQVRGLMRLAENLGGKRIIFLPLKPFGKDEFARGYYEQYALTSQEQEVAVREIYGGKSKLDIFYDEPFVWNLSRRHGFTMSSADSGITIPEVQGCAASCSLYIQTDGSVRPCMFAAEDLTFGNATRESLGDIWSRMSSSEIITSWADQVQRKGACRECPQFVSCRGCLARTTRLLGDPLSADPCCPLAASPALK